MSFITIAKEISEFYQNFTKGKNSSSFRWIMQSLGVFYQGKSLPYRKQRIFFNTNALC